MHGIPHQLVRCYYWGYLITGTEWWVSSEHALVQTVVHEFLSSLSLGEADSLGIDCFLTGTPKFDVCGRAYVESSDMDDDAKWPNVHRAYAESKGMSWPVSNSPFQLPKATKLAVFPTLCALPHREFDVAAPRSQLINKPVWHRQFNRI